MTTDEFLTDVVHSDDHCLCSGYYHLIVGNGNGKVGQLN